MMVRAVLSRVVPRPGRASILALFALFACGTPNPEQQLATAEAVAAEAARDSSRVSDAVNLLEAFITDHAGSPLAARAVKYLAILRQQRGDMPGAIATYERLLQTYPAAAEADEAQFMIAFIYEEHLADVEAARAAYQAVIDNYPESELAANARRLLPHVGRPPEEWVLFQDDPPAP